MSLHIFNIPAFGGLICKIIQCIGSVGFLQWCITFRTNSAFETCLLFSVTKVQDSKHSISVSLFLLWVKIHGRYQWVGIIRL